MAGFAAAVSTVPQLSFEDYEIQFPHLQEGGWGKVYSAVVKGSSQSLEREKDANEEYVAMKFFGYTRQQPITSEIMKEINLMKSLIGVEGVVQLVGVLTDPPQGYSNHSLPFFVILTSPPPPSLPLPIIHSSQQDAFLLPLLSGDCHGDAPRWRSLPTNLNSHPCLGELPRVFFQERDPSLAIGARQRLYPSRPQARQPHGLPPPPVSYPR